MKQDCINFDKCLKELQEFPLFKGLPSQSLKVLLGLTTLHEWPKKKLVITTANKPYKFYLIMSGRVKAYSYDLRTGRQLTLFILTVKDAFDICTLIEQCDHKLNYETIDKTVALSIPLVDIRSWIDKNSIASKTVFKYMALKMLQLETYLTEMSMDDTQTRLAKLLLKHMNTTSRKIEMINNLSHEELAMFIGTTRAVLNRHIQEFKEQGIISVSRKHIEILDSTELTKRTTSSLKQDSLTKKGYLS